MVFAAEKVAEKMAGLPGGHGQPPEAKIDDVDGTSMIEMPAPADGGGQRHLSRADTKNCWTASMQIHQTS